MKTLDIGFERFEEDFYADINTMYVKPKEEAEKAFTERSKEETKEVK